MGRNGNMVKNGGGNGVAVAPVTGNEAAKKTVLNQYMTWSVALNAARNDEEIRDLLKDTPLSNTKEEEVVKQLTFGHFFNKTSEEGKPVEALDLGGGDQEKILIDEKEAINTENKKRKEELSEEELSEEEKNELINEIDKIRKKTVDKYKYSADAKKEGIVFTTGGSDDKRLDNLAKLKDKGVNSNVSALTLDNETALTAVSYYDYAIDKLKKSEYKNILAIPIGSTDVHVINYDQYGTVETRNLANYKTGDATEISEFVSKHVVEGETLIVFAASAYHTIGKQLKVIDAEAVIGKKLPEIFTQDYYKTAGEKGQPKLDDLYTILDKLKIISNNSGTREVTDKFKKIKFTVSNSKQAGEKEPLTYDAFKAVYKPATNVNGILTPANTSKTASNFVSGIFGNVAERASGAQQPAATVGGKRRRTRKVSKNRRKSMKAKNMRRKNKNKSSKGKKSKTSRRR